jgi:hypothetical protein
MTTGHFQVSEGMAVLDADRERVGQVKEVRDSDFLIDRPLGHAIFVPFGAIGEVMGREVVLTITAAHLDSIKWPHQGEAADNGSDGTIAL